MNLGMIGALGGVGKSFLDQSAYLGKVEDEERAEARTVRAEGRADTRQRSYQEWLMQTREQFDIRTEERGTARRETEKDKDYDRLQREAPTRREIKAEDVSSEAEARQTDTDREYKEAQTDKLRADADYITGAKTNEADARAAAKGAGKTRLAPEKQAELKEIQEGIKTLRGKKADAEASGAWDPNNLQPGQKSIQAQIVTLEKRQRALLGGEGPTADPLGARKPAPAAPAGRTSGASMFPTEASMKGAATSDMGADPATIRSEIRQTEAALANGSITDPQDQQNAREYVSHLQASLQRLGRQQAPAAGSMIAPVSGPMPQRAARLPRSLADVPGAKDTTPRSRNVTEFAGDYRTLVDSLRQKAYGQQQSAGYGEE